MYMARLMVVTGIALAMIRPVYAQTIDLPGGGKVIISQSSTTDGGSVKTTEEAKGTGASGTATGDKSDLKITGDAPAASLSGGGKATGGTMQAAGSAKIDASLFGNPLLWVGILCLLGSGVTIYLRLPIRDTFISAGVGVAFVCAAMFPGLMLFLVAGGAVALLVWYLYASHTGNKANEALRAVAAGVSGLPASVAADVKAEISKHADARDKATISAVKQADNLQ